MPSDQDPPRPAEPSTSPSRRRSSSRMPPADLGPDGADQRRGPSPSNRLIVLAGAGVMAAAVTAAGILAARRLIRAIDGDRDDAAKTTGKRDHLAPRFARMTEDEREALRARARARARRDRNEIARLRAEAARERAAPRRHRPDNLAQRATRLSGSLAGLVTSLAGAVSGLRMVAAQASGIMREFSDAAEMVRAVLNPEDGPAAEGHGDKARRPEPDRAWRRAEDGSRDEARHAESPRNPARDRTHRL